MIRCKSLQCAEGKKVKDYSSHVVHGKAVVLCYRAFANLTECASRRVLPLILSKDFKLSATGFDRKKWTVNCMPTRILAPPENRASCSCLPELEMWENASFLCAGSFYEAGLLSPHFLLLFVLAATRQEQSAREWQSLDLLLMGRKQPADQEHQFL